MTQRLVKYRGRLLLVLAFGLTAAVGCSDSFDRSLECPKQPVTIGFGIGASGSDGKTVIAADGISTSWQESDKVYLWAKGSGDEYVLSQKEFQMHGYYKGEAVFLTELPEPMAEGEYLYYACYPKPESVNGTSAVFDIPSLQDGKISNGADIMVAEPVTHRELTPYITGQHSELNLSIRHQLHVLRFFLPEGSDGLNGEPIRRIKVEFSKNVCGKMTLDVSDPYAEASLSEGRNLITLKLDNPLQPSTESGRNYACAAICPTSFSDGGTMKITLISSNWIGTARNINLSGREFVAGHCTAVRMTVADIEPLYTLSFSLKSNNLGENIQKANIELNDTSCQLGDEGSYTYAWEPGGDITVGNNLKFSYADIGKFFALSGKKVTITYDSQHVRCSEVITIPNLSALRDYECALNVPWLLYEDFSGVNTFSSDDEYKTSKAGAYDATSFLNGWTGARCGAEAGKCIRIACRRETSADYPARVDSAPLAGKLKSDVDLIVSFDYGGNLEYTDSWILGNGSTGQTCYVGYGDKTGGLKSNDTSGTYDRNVNSFYLPKTETSGSYNNTPYHASIVLSSVSGGKDVIRIAWRSEIEHKAGTTNCTSWFYIDNVKVKVKNN